MTNMANRPISPQFDRELLDALGIEDFVPPALARWRPLVLDGLAFFLGALSEARVAGITQQQLGLPLAASPARRLAVLMGACPTLHKLGQVVARHRHLPAVLRGELQALESLPPVSDLAAIRAAIEAELPSGLGYVFGDSILAEGSVAAVLPFSYAADGARAHGVFKVLKPGVEAQLAEELAILAPLADFLRLRCNALGIEVPDLAGVFGHVRDLLTRELKLEVEQANMAEAATFHGGDARILIPRLLPGCGPRLTVMERVFGGKLPDVRLSDGERRRLARDALGALLARPFWSEAPMAVFHGDPHGGNLLATDDGRIAVIDWSLVARLSKAQREAIVAAVIGGILLDAAMVREAVARLTGMAADDARLVAVVEDGLAALRAPRFAGADWLIGLLDALASAARLSPSQDLVLFRKSWLTIAGVVADLSAADAADPVLVCEGLGRWLGEWPLRILARPDSRHFATHLSNADLFAAWAACWSWPLRYWGGWWGGVVQRAGGSAMT